MAAFLLMNYFFPGDKNHKRIIKAKEDFIKDMSFNLPIGVITHTIDKFLNSSDKKNHQS